MTNPEPRWVNRVTAQKYLDVSDATFYRYTAAGLVPKHSIGGTTRYDLNELDAILRGDTTTRPNGPTTYAGATAADALARVREAIPLNEGRPQLIHISRVHETLDTIAAELGISAGATRAG